MDSKDQAPHLANPNGVNLGDENYPRIDNMNPDSYGKPQHPFPNKIHYAAASQFPRPSKNPDFRKYADANTLGKSKLVK